ncbi:MAG: SIR2 family protein, partial [Anaerolineae bacterium]|nr:SIR2 family protein [Anaerolineae bacterium]
PVLFMRLTSGQLWGAEADVRGLVLGAKQPRIFWSGLIKNIERGKCTPLIGPRAHSRWLPQPADIARDWAEEHGYPFKDREDLARVAQYIVSSQGEEFAREDLLDTTMRLFIDRLPEGLKPEDEYDTLTELIEAVGWQDVTSDDPNEVHKVLASLNLPLYLTTNVDSFMTEALKANGREPAREICPWNEYLDGMPSLFEDDPDYEPTKEAPLVYHLFGNDQQVDSLVLTEDNYLDFLVQTAAAPERIPPHIWAALTNSSLMFIGYSLNDWEFRVVMRGLVATRQQRRRFKHVAVQLELDDMEATDTEAVQSFLQDYFQDAEINVYWGSLQQFVAELREQWEAVEAD